MSRNIDELIRNLQKLEDGIHGVLLKTASVMAHDGKSLAERTIKDRGFGAKYSNNPIPAFYMYGKELNKSGRNYLDNSDEPVNWKGFRQSQGLQTNHVDLAYSTRMWKGMRPDDPINEGSFYFCYLGHNDQEGRNKMNWNFERYGDFIGKALEGQEELLKDVAIENLGNFIEEMLIN